MAEWGNGITPEKAGKKGDHLIGDFYVLFDKHYKAEIKQIAQEKTYQRKKLKNCRRSCRKPGKCCADGKTKTQKYARCGK